MFAFIIVIIFSIICVINVALIFGAPLGEFTMGGKYKVLPPLSMMAAICFWIMAFQI